MSEFEDVYVRMQGAFRERCGREADELHDLTRDGRLGGAPAVALLHRLAGAAGTFGFEVLTERALRLETQIRQGVVDLADNRLFFAELADVAAGRRAATPLTLALA